MRSAAAVTVIGALCVSCAGAFVIPVARPSISSATSSTASRRGPVRRFSGPSMSSVATQEPATQQLQQQPVTSRAKVQPIRSSDDYTKAKAKHDDKLVVIKFYDKFCKACDEVRPRFEDLSRSLPQEEAVFFDLEFSENKELCRQLGIRRLPTVQIYDGAAGRVADLPAGPSRFSDVENRFSEIAAAKSRSG